MCIYTYTHICRNKKKSKGIKSRIFKSAVTSRGERRGHIREGTQCPRGKVMSVPEVGNGDSFMLAQTYYMHSFLDGMHFTKRRKDGREVGGRFAGRKEEREGEGDKGGREADRLWGGDLTSSFHPSGSLWTCKQRCT